MRSSVLGTLLVDAFEGLEASGGGPSVSSGTRFASGSSSSVAFSSSIVVAGAPIVDVEGVIACTAIAGAEKLNHRLRKRAIRRTAGPALSNLIEAQRHSVLWGSFIIFCEARLSSDCAGVKELQMG
jgi:hypothetical protein